MNTPHRIKPSEVTDRQVLIEAKLASLGEDSRAAIEMEVAHLIKTVGISRVSALELLYLLGTQMNECEGGEK